ncbi:MAG: SDR family oxidoreductase [Planctomycetaceae bacterium]|nr:MAG: SDR family oxidoreductase [Planctomycetaceae bacterium]
MLTDWVKPAVEQTLLPATSSSIGVAVVTGGSAGLGFGIAAELIRADYRVAIIGRDAARVEIAAERLNERTRSTDRCLGLVGDVTDPASVRSCFERVEQTWGRLDVLVNCVGRSDRGRVESLTPERLAELIAANVTSTLLCSQAALASLCASGGTVVNIGSLAGKIGSRYLGGYCAAKHALSGLTQQMRLEWRDYGVHVALVSPGPIRREDAGRRYAAEIDGLPASAAQPAGGARLRGLATERVAAEVLSCIRRRHADRILPRRVRLLLCLLQAFPACGDWLVLKFTGGSATDDSAAGGPAKGKRGE